MKVNTILDQIDMGSMALPEFQRGYVWNRNQVRGLMDSLYHRHPVGSLLVWTTKTENAVTRGDEPLAAGTVKLLLDGQQRITSLYGIIRGKPPRFFDGNERVFKGLYFNLADENFEFYAQQKMKDNPLWVDVSALMLTDVGTFVDRIYANEKLRPEASRYIPRLTRIHSIRDIELHIDEVTGDDKTIDVVVDVFNRVNSGGTKLSSGDLALAKICAKWPEARDAMKARLAKWRRAGYNFRLEWLLRCVNSTSTGKAYFSALEGVDRETFRVSLEKTEDAIDKLLNHIAGRLGLDHDRVLGSVGSFPLMVRYLVQKGGRFDNHRERDRLLYWYLHTMLWGRYAGSTDSVLSKDLRAIESLDGALDRLIEGIRENRGDLTVTPADFAGWSKGARFYPLLYMLTRVENARDWETGDPLRANLLGRLSRLEVHHTFPKKVLRKDYKRAEVNAIANFTFLTQETNLIVLDKKPKDYLPTFVAKQPGAVESHWIPMDPALWEVDRYRDFLAKRRELLANAATNLLASLRDGTGSGREPSGSVLDRDPVKEGGVATSEEEAQIVDIRAWLVKKELPEGEIDAEAVGDEGGVVNLDLAWPNGIQEGYSEPVALMLDEDRSSVEIAEETGYRVFRSVRAFKRYVRKRILKNGSEAEEGEAVTA